MSASEDRPPPNSPGAPRQPVRSNSQESRSASPAPADERGASRPASQQAAAGQGLLPSLSLPKGGGAIRGIGEKYSTNPATGTGSLSVPIATSPGRAGFDLKLELAYDSGAGNGPFGIGWRLSTPSITRKTDKGLPRYLDAADSDTFVLSGAEDLVPVPTPSDAGDADHEVQRYRPRVEGLFARIERWTRTRDGDVHWRAITRDNVLNIYGRSPDARIAAPRPDRKDPLQHPAEGRDARVFSWLLEETRDDRGNAACYQYIAEDDADVSAEGPEISRFRLTDKGELFRDASGEPVFDTTAQRYLKRILYGNRNPLERDAPLPDDPSNWLFEVVLDYGEHAAPPRTDPPELGWHASTAPDPETVQAWPRRPDAFSSCRAGFEVRTYRLCRRVLMFHRFPELPKSPCLVRSTDFFYDENPFASYLVATVQSGYEWDPQPPAGYRRATLPALQLDYIRPNLEANDRKRSIEAGSLAGIPSGVDGRFHQWVDLHGEGIPGVLSPQPRNWWYKRNLGGGRLAAASALMTMPSHADLNAGMQLTDLGGDGHLDLLSYAAPVQGYFARTADGDWEAFRPFRELPNIDWNAPNLRLFDVDGDGHPDVLISGERAFAWYRSRAKEGFEPALFTPKAADERLGAAVVFADGTETIFLADMSGDGLADITRVRNGEVCYWPNLGYARFGPKVTLAGSPKFAPTDEFDPRRVRFADIDGSGTSDVLYLGARGLDVYLNESGNRLSAPYRVKSLPTVDSASEFSAVDLLGQGSSCLVWSSSSPANRTQPVVYVDLSGGRKPHLLERITNNLGAETRIAYAPSTRFYLEDRERGRPWLTRLSFPVHVVARTERYDHINESHLVTRFAYHHGYFDGHEREFRGFAHVTQWDAEAFGGPRKESLFPEIAEQPNSDLILPPVRTETWFHTGAWLDRERLEHALAESYYQGDPLAPLLADTILPPGLSVRERREATRALRGQILRQEIYAEDPAPEHIHPYSVSERNYEVRLIEHAGEERNGVFFVHPSETINLHYERRPDDPRLQHELVLAVDNNGNVVQSAAIAYPRREDRRLEAQQRTTRDLTEQSRLWATITEASFINRGDAPAHYEISSPATPAGRLMPIAPGRDIGWYRAGVPVETVTWELTGVQAPALPRPAYEDRVADWQAHSEAIRQVITRAAPQPYEATPDAAQERRRLIEAQRVRYYDDEADPPAPLPLGAIGSRALQFETYRLALTRDLIDATFQYDAANPIPVADAILRNEGRYLHHNDIPVAGPYGEVISPALRPAAWWAPSGHPDYVNLAQATAAFFLPERAYDPFDGMHVVGYDQHKLLIERATDPLQNQTRAENDYRVLAPWTLTDPNENKTAVAFDALGMVIKTAIMGRPGANEGDTLTDPTTELTYDLHRWRTSGFTQPAFVRTRMRERHRDPATRWQESFSYSDGAGREVMRKIQAEPGDAFLREPPANGSLGPLRRDPAGRLVPGHSDDRWVGTGRTVFDNKGNPVRKYEPFFSSTHEFEDEDELVEWGVTPTLRYDPLGRLIRTDQPNGTYSQVRFDAWAQESWDENDTVRQSRWWNERGGDLIASEPGRGVVTTDLNVLRQHADQRATWLAGKHADTPTVVHLDALGRAFLNVDHNRIGRSGEPSTDEHYETRIALDIEGNQVSVTDARGVVVLRQVFDVLGRVLHSISPDAGRRWTLLDVGDKPVRAWDSRLQQFRRSYDALQRPTHVFAAPESGRERLVQRTVYGESPGVPDAVARRLRGQIYRDYDGAGVVTNERFDFKGNLEESSRRLFDYRNRPNDSLATPWPRNRLAPDWTPLATAPDAAQIHGLATPLLEAETFTVQAQYDALNRVVLRATPDGSITRPGYNEANLLDRIDVWMKAPAGTQLAPGLLPGGAQDDNRWTCFVSDIDYNARGQREEVRYGQQTNTVTTYEYDPATFRLINLKTLRNGTTPLQDLYYFYDLVGNITGILDGAQQTVFFDNAVVTAHGKYRYDAIYQLIEAEGREHPGQQPTHENYPLLPYNIPHPNDIQALRNYTERYFYDAVGNIERMKHEWNNGTSSSSWTRWYAYEADGALRPISNRLMCTSLPGDTVPPIEPHRASATRSPYSARYEHDAHGNMTRMPHLPQMNWDYADRLVGVDLNGGGEAFYAYDGSGQRVRKVVMRSPTTTLERVYLGGYEIYRERNGNPSRLEFERETLHVMDDQRRVALVETKTREGGAVVAAGARFRYQLDNHLGSCLLELDHEGEVITYEEYFPFGGTSYRAARTDGRYAWVRKSPKRYRYNGKERDEETGFYYYGARYYVGWLGRWVAADPIGTADGPNLFRFVRNCPLRFVDEEGERPAIPLEPEGFRPIDIQGGGGSAPRPLTGPNPVLYALLLLSAKEAYDKYHHGAPVEQLDLPPDQSESAREGRRALGQTLFDGGLIDEEALRQFIEHETLFFELPGVGAPKASPIPQSPEKADSNSPRHRTTKRAHNRAFAREMLRKILDEPTHLLGFLVDRDAGTWLGRSHLDEEVPSMQVGHGTSLHSGAEERLYLEDALFNQLSNWLGETKGVIFEKSGVLIGGVPVELRTAIMWENLGLLPPGTVSGAAASEGYVPLSPENAIPVSEQELEDFRIEDPNRAQDVSLR